MPYPATPRRPPSTPLIFRPCSSARREAEKREKTPTSHDRQRGPKLPMASVNLTSSTILSTRSPGSRSGSHAGPVPATGAKELPEAALLLLRELWMNLGYEGTQFVEMQMEIERELQTGDFARFEREMLCNEILAQRTEINKLRTERTELLRRNAATKDDLADVLAAEEKTYRALLSERELAQRQLADAEEAAHSASMDAEKEAVKVGVLSEEMERLERAHVAAVIYAKKVETKMMVWDHAAPKVNVTAVPQRPGLVRRAPSTASAPNIHQAVSDTAITGWTDRDEAQLTKKLQERKVAAEDARLAAEEKRVAADRAKARLEQDRMQHQHDGLRAAVDTIRSAAAGHRSETASKVLPSMTPRRRDMSWCEEAPRRSAWGEERLTPVGSGIAIHAPMKVGVVPNPYGTRSGVAMGGRPPLGKKLPGGW